MQFHVSIEVYEVERQVVGIHLSGSTKVVIWVVRRVAEIP